MDYKSVAYIDKNKHTEKVDSSEIISHTADFSCIPLQIKIIPIVVQLVLG